MPGRFPFPAAVASVAAALALSACSGADAPQGPRAQPVTVVTLQAEPVTLVRELPARVNAHLIAEVRPQVSGIIEKRLFTEGGEVKEGQALYQLDDSTYRAELASARATLARAEATLESARLNETRTAELAKVDAVSQQDLENATAALQQAQADVKLSQANVRTREIQLDYARITAPISGNIGKSSVTQGALVTQNQAQALATVQQLDPIYVDATASSTELLQLRRDLEAGTIKRDNSVPVSIILEDGTRYRHDGRLTFADVTVDPTTGTFSLRVLAPNPDRILMPGMYVRTVFTLGVRPNGLLVPQQGIARDAKGQTSALVVGAGDKVERRDVQVSRSIDDKWLVESGLEAGDRVIIEGLQKVQPGDAVQPAEAQG